MIDKLRTLLESKLPPGSFIRNVVTLMTGTTFAQALIILVAPILTRLYSPEDFGVFALYTSILGIITVVACWRYELAIVLPEKDEDATDLLVLSICICFGMAILTLILVAVVRNPIANLLGAPELAPWLWFMPLSLLVAGLFQAFNYWSTRRKQFRRLAIRQITQSTVTAGTQLGSGFLLHPGASGLIAGSILGQTIATARLIWDTIRIDCKSINYSFNLNNLRSKLAEYRRFPLFLSLAGLLNVTSSQIPIIMLGYYFGSTVVGFFSLGFRIIALPLSVIGGSVGQVFFPRASEAYQRGYLSDITFETFSRLFSLILVPVLLLMISGPDLVAVIFGSNWKIAGEYLVWLGPRFIVQFISSPLSMALLVLQRQDLNLKIDGLLFVTNLSLLIIGGMLGDPFLAIKMFGIGTFSCYMIACLIIFRVSSVPINVVLTKCLYTFLQALPYVVVPLIILFITEEALLVTMVSILSGVFFLLFNFRSFLKSI